MVTYATCATIQAVATVSSTSNDLICDNNAGVHFHIQKNLDYPNLHYPNPPLSEHYF